VLAALRLQPSGGSVIVRGRTSSGTWEERLSVGPVAPQPGGDHVPALWARAAIEELELDLACGGMRAAIDRRIEEIARAHSIASRLTSWVAVATEQSVDPRAPVRHDRIPQALPYGMRSTAVWLGAPMIAGSLSRTIPGDEDSSAPVRAPSAIAMPQRQAPRHERAGGTRRFLDQLRDILSHSLDRLHRGRGRLHDILQRVEAEAELASEPGGGDEAVRRTIAARRSELIARMEELIGEELVSAHDMERLQLLIDRLRRQIHAEAEAADRVEVVHGRIVRAASRATTTVEFQTVSRLDWQPGPLAYCGDRPIAVVESGTTRGGPTDLGTMVRLELRIAPDVILGSGRIEIATIDRTLIVLLDAERT
jgi:hypothetical protein